mmetsp:Transcript_2474/g.3785  ORF Transcript_2474/g.3785 Transcript_2474/m.3785 type:complete len:101 (-) Transcript_2474:217-519(-)
MPSSMPLRRRMITLIVSCLILMMGASSAAEHSLRAASNVGCGVFKKDLCSPSLECFWCDNHQSNSDGKEESPNNNEGLCMEFDAWIDSCPIAAASSQKKM